MIDNSRSVTLFCLHSEGRSPRVQVSIVLCLQKMKTPWKRMLTSGPFWAIVAAHSTYTWVTSWMMSYLPKYLSDMLKFNVQEVIHNDSVALSFCRLFPSPPPSPTQRRFRDQNVYNY